MEHDEKRIREKLLQWESTPYDSNTERLWNERLAFPGKRSRRSIVVYYAAASLVLAAAIVYYGFTTLERAKTNLQIKEIDLAMVKAGQSMQTVALDTVVIPCPEPALLNTRGQTSAPRSRIAIATVLVQKEEPIEPVQRPEGIANVESPLAVEPEVAQPVKTAPSKPRVILGRTPVEQIQKPSSKIRLAIFKSEATDEKSSTQQPVVLAGINNQ